MRRTTAPVPPDMEWRTGTTFRTDDDGLRRLTEALTGVKAEDVNIYPDGQLAVSIDEHVETVIVDGRLRSKTRRLWFWISRVGEGGMAATTREETLCYALPELRPPMVRRSWNMSPNPCMCRIVEVLGLCPFCGPGAHHPVVVRVRQPEEKPAKRWSPFRRAKA